MIGSSRIIREEILNTTTVKQSKAPSFMQRKVNLKSHMLIFPISYDNNKHDTSVFA